MLPYVQSLMTKQVDSNKKLILYVFQKTNYPFKGALCLALEKNLPGWK
jgi:hypothetical protein